MLNKYSNSILIGVIILYLIVTILFSYGRIATLIIPFLTLLFFLKGNWSKIEGKTFILISAIIGTLIWVNGNVLDRSWSIVVGFGIFIFGVLVVTIINFKKGLRG